MTAAFQKEVQRITPLPMPVSFERFLEWYPDSAQYRYELRRGVIYQMPKPRGKHSQIAGDIAKKLNYAIDELGLPYFIPRECIIKIDDDTGYEPDVVVLDETKLTEEPMWEKRSTVQNGNTVRLAVEVVSSNWQDDYELKMAAYESIGVPQYWIVDYVGLGDVHHIGRPKRPPLTVCTLVDSEYEVIRLQGEATEAIPADGERSGRDTGGGWGQPEPTRGTPEIIRKIARRRRIRLDVDRLEAEMQQLVGVVNKLFQSVPAESAGGLRLDEVTLSVEVNAEEQLSLLDTGGKLGGKGSITLTFARPK